MLPNIVSRDLEQAHLNLIDGLAREEQPSRPRRLIILSNEHAYTPSHEEILATFLRNFTGRGIPKSRPVHALNIEFLLTPEQAMRGTSVPLSIPLFEPCPTCEGTGQAGYYGCDVCEGRGMIDRFHRLDVLIPAGCTDGEMIPVSLGHAGVRNIYLNFRVRVADLQ